MSEELTPGPAMDAAVGGVMGVEAKWWGVSYLPPCGGYDPYLTRAEAEARASDGKGVVVPVWPAYSTSSAWEQVADWLEQFGFPVLEMQAATPRYRLVVWSSSDGGEPFADGAGATRALAVCRAVLALGERGEQGR